MSFTDHTASISGNISISNVDHHAESKNRDVHSFYIFCTVNFILIHKSRPTNQCNKWPIITECALMHKSLAEALETRLGGKASKIRSNAARSGFKVWSHTCTQ